MDERLTKHKQLVENIKAFRNQPADIERSKIVQEQLLKSIQYRYERSQINNNYEFPRNTPLKQHFYGEKQMVNLYENSIESQNFSVAEEAQTRAVNFSSKTYLITQRKKTPIKIKLFKKKQKFIQNHEEQSFRFPIQKIQTKSKRKQNQTITPKKTLNNSIKMTSIQKKERSFEKLRYELSKQKIRKQKENIARNSLKRGENYLRIQPKAYENKGNFRFINNFQKINISIR